MLVKLQGGAGWGGGGAGGGQVAKVMRRGLSAPAARLPAAGVPAPLAAAACCPPLRATCSTHEGPRLHPSTALLCPALPCTHPPPSPRPPPPERRLSHLLLAGALVREHAVAGQGGCGMLGWESVKQGAQPARNTGHAMLPARPACREAAATARRAAPEQARVLQQQRAAPGAARQVGEGGAKALGRSAGRVGCVSNQAPRRAGAARPQANSVRPAGTRQPHAEAARCRLSAARCPPATNPWPSARAA